VNEVENVADKRRRPTRAEKADHIRKALFDAAATVVGRDGYEEASVSKITALAGVASGTFYNYFENRQDLFNRLLPAIGDGVIDFIRDRVRSATSGAQQERERLEAYFAFFEQNPGFLRLLNEAEVFAPPAYEEHIQRFAVRFMRALQRDRERGLLANFDDGQLEAAVFMLLGCRSYMTLLLKRSDKHNVKGLVDAYIKLIIPGLYGRSQAAQCSSAELI